MAHMNVYMVRRPLYPFVQLLIGFAAQDYCVNQANAAKVLQSLRQTKPDLATKLQVSMLVLLRWNKERVLTIWQQLRDDPAVRNLDLSSYLLVPSTCLSCLLSLSAWPYLTISVQRITRYPLLIKQVC